MRVLRSERTCSATATLKGSIRNLGLLVSKKDRFQLDIPLLIAVRRDQITSGCPTIQQLSRYKRFRVAFPQNHPLRPEDFPTARLRLRRKRRTLARLPHAFISHQSRIPLRLLSQTTTNTFLPSIAAGVRTPLM